VNKLEEVMKLALIKAKELGYDVFNALSIMDNAAFLNELKFGPGDGSLHFYLYNWKLKSRLEPGNIGIVLV
jgi:glycylpeptide N-tetradecanoyltransferase